MWMYDSWKRVQNVSSGVTRSAEYGLGTVRQRRLGRAGARGHVGNGGSTVIGMVLVLGNNQLRSVHLHNKKSHQTDPGGPDVWFPTRSTPKKPDGVTQGFQ